MKIQRWVCQHCKSPNIENSTWVNTNTEIVNSNIDIDGYWCQDCGMDTTIEINDGVEWEVSDEKEFIDLEIYGVVPYISYESTNLIDWFYIGHCVLKSESEVNADKQSKIYHSEPFKTRIDAVRDLCNFINNIKN